MAPKQATGMKVASRVLEEMKAATGASEEDICVMLQLCNGDANEATEKLLESEFGPSSAGCQPGEQCH